MFIVLLWACTSMPSSGHLFEAVPVTAPAEAEAKADAKADADAKAEADAKATDPEWDPSKIEEAPVISSDQLQQGSEVIAKDLFGNPVDLPPSAPKTPAPAAKTPIAAPAPTTMGLPSDPWPVRLVATLPEAQPPRAILGLPSGEERVVSPGSILPDQGLVVMSVSKDKVQLAKITPAGDHATILSTELQAQYPK